MTKNKHTKLICIVVLFALCSPLLWGGGWVSYYAVRNKVLAPYLGFNPDEQVRIRWDWLPRSIAVGVWLANPGGTVVVPDGDRTISTDLSLGSQTKAIRLLLGHGTITMSGGARILFFNGSQIIGSGRDDPSRAPATVIVGNNTTPVIEKGSTANQAVYQVSIRNLRISNTSSATAGGMCIRFENNQSSDIQDVSCTDAENGIMVVTTVPSFAGFNTLSRLEVTAIAQVAIGINGNANQVWGGHVSAGATGIEIDGQENQIYGISLENNTTEAYQIGVTGGSARNAIIGGHIENTPIGIDCTGGNANQTYMVGIAFVSVTDKFKSCTNVMLVVTESEFYNLTTGVGDRGIGIVSFDELAPVFLDLDDRSQPAADRRFQIRNVSKQLQFHALEGNFTGVSNWKVDRAGNIFPGSSTQELGSDASNLRWGIGEGLDPDGSGLKHTRIASCTTAATQFATCTSTWTFTTNDFDDANYTAKCTIDNPTNLPIVAHTTNKLVSAVDIVVMAMSAAAASGTLNCIAVHD